MCKKTLPSIYGMHIILTFCFTLIRICDRFFAIFSMHHISEKGTGENLISRRHKLLKLLQKSYLISDNELMDISMTIWFYILLYIIIRISKLSINKNNMQQRMSIFWKNLLGFPCISSFMYFFVSCSDNKPKTCGSAAIRVYQ